MLLNIQSITKFVFGLSLYLFGQSQNIVTQRIKIIGNRKIKMSSQGSQMWLRSPKSPKSALSLIGVRQYERVQMNITLF